MDTNAALKTPTVWRYCTATAKCFLNPEKQKDKQEEALSQKAVLLFYLGWGEKTKVRQTSRTDKSKDKQ